MFNYALADSLATDQVADCHTTCIECQADGCTGCPSAFCDLPRLVEHEREHMHAECVAAFDIHTDNRCTGDICNCPSDGVPLACDTEETTPAEPLTDRQIAALDPLGVFRRLALVAALVLACLSGIACAHGPVAVEPAETVGQLSAGPSTWTAPVAHDAPPVLGFVAGSDDDSTGEVATTVTRADAGDADAAPAVVGKGGGLTTGSVR